MSQGNEKIITTPDDMELLLRTRDKSPALYDRVMELLNIVDDRKRRTADDVEFQVIDTLRGSSLGCQKTVVFSQNHYPENRPRIYCNNP